LCNSKWTELVLRYFLGITFVYASVHKIAEPAEFAKIIYGYGLFPHAFINLIAIVAPFLELFTGLFLIAGIYPRAAGSLICGMLLVFICAISINLIRGYEFDCGCFSFNQHTSKFSTHFLLVRDVVYFLVGVYLIRFNADRTWRLIRGLG
jgi:uncharacterized membrane protein YphA (DoxX/SURF4 family)